MFAGKNQASQAPTAFGSMLQASTYGMVIPVVYGVTQSPLLAIWAANLRQGGSTKKFKQMKKGITAYCENIDFLLGKNPILGVLQLWNNGSLFPLNYTKYSIAVTRGAAAAIPIPDSHFYAVVGVTITLPYSETFNDYGGGGSATLTGSMEFPLWNQLLAGPDPTDSSDPRNWPYTYRWAPSYGAEIFIDTLATGALAGGTVNVYYAQLMDATSFQPPIAKNKLSFESILGSGDEYDGFTAQQIQYPAYAGLGSPNIDLGSAGVIPALKAEVQGKWGLYGTGDCDFVDMIEDVVKSGITQSAVASAFNFGPTEHGVGQYGFPGCMQKKLSRDSLGTMNPVAYDLPNTAGNILVVVVKGYTGPLAVASSAGETWTPVFPGTLNYQVWYANAVGGANAVTVTGSSFGGETEIFEIAGAAGVDVVTGDATIDAVSNVQAAFNAYLLAITFGGQLPAPVPLAPGQQMVWVYPTSAGATVGGGSSAAGDISGGGVVQFSSGITNGTSTFQFGGFATPTLPPGAVIDKAYYAGFVSSGIGSGAVAGSTLGGLGTSGFQYSARSLPIDGAVMTISTDATVPWTGAYSPAFLSIATPAIALYYHVPGSPGPGSGGGGAAMGAANVAQWDLITPDNFYGQGPLSFRGYGRVVRNPGSFPFQLPPNFAAPQALALLSFRSVTPPTNPRASGSFLDLASMGLVRAQCRAGGLWGSLSMNVQKAASDWINDLCQAADCVAVMSGFKLKLLPRSEVSAVGNGAVYVAPTAAGPVADLDADNGDFVAEKGKSPIVVTRKARIDTDTVLQMQHLNRASNYQQVVTAEPDPAGIALYGIRKKDPATNNAVQDVGIARSILSIEVRRRNYVEPLSYAFTLNARWAFLDTWDLVTITDRLQGIVKVPVRLTSTEESEKFDIACEAEPFVYGVHAPLALPAIATEPYSPSAATTLSAGDVNPPLIFEPVPRLYANGPQAQLWLVISSAAANYGGCQVMVSTDGGASYNPLGDPVVGGAITGELTADWPAALDPDTTNDLAVNLAESNGALESYAVSDEDNFVYPCYVQGDEVTIENNGTVVAVSSLEFKCNSAVVAGSIGFGYELMTYAAAQLTTANQYTLKATGSGNHLRRAVFSAPDGSGAGVFHASGARWAFLSPAGAGIFKAAMDAVWVGQTLYFKILSFNTFGAALQGLGDVPAYSYVPTGVPSMV